MTTTSISEETEWAPPPDILELTSEEEFTAVQEIIKNAIRKTARLHAYNTLDTFVSFHQAYRSQKELTLEEFTMTSTVRHEDSSLSCVGLSHKVVKYVSEADATLGRHLFLAICNDFGLDAPAPKESPPVEFASLFDHVFVVLAFSFKGRKGYMFADNALLVDFPIVIMADCQWPHTGQFSCINRDGVRESHVQLANDQYAVWNQTNYKPDGKLNVRKRFVYLGKPFLNTDNVDRRNKVDVFHGYILMGRGGFKAGLFILLGKDNRRFTLAVPKETGGFLSVQLPYDFFCSESGCDEHILNDETRGALESFSNMCGFGGIEALLKKFRPLSETCKDQDFIDEAIILNKQFDARMFEYVLNSAQQ